MEKTFKKVLALTLIVISVLSLAACGSSASTSKGGKTLKIGVPDDATNMARAIKLVEKAGLIEVDPSVGYAPELKDITNYIYSVELVPTQANTLPATLEDYAGSTINGTYAVPAGLLPSRDALIIETQEEGSNNPYVNIVVARTEEKDKETYKKIVAAVQKQNVAEFILQEYNEMFFPAFKYDKNFSASADFVKEFENYKSPKEGKEVIKVGVCGQNNLYWNVAQKNLDDEGANIYIELVEFDAYNLPNQALANGEIDLNSFQHVAYLNKELGAKGYALTPIGDTIIAPLSLYSKKYKDLDALKADCAK